MTTRYLLKCLLLLSALFCQQALFGQTGSPGTISTYAGNDALFAGGGQLATAAQLVGPNNIAFDGKGNVYFSASGLAMVLKVAANGIISVVAGNGLSSGGGDGGLATGASLAYPAGLAFDSSGNLYIVDSYNSNVRKVDTNGIITTVAGDGGAGGFAGDGGPATKALLQNPEGIAVDKSGNLYIADSLNQRIRMVAASTGIISTIAGSNNTGWHGDGGPAAQATFTLPSNIAIDSAGNLYIADQNNCSVRRISTSGIITTVAGSGQWGYGGDGGQATKATMAGTRSVALDASGNLYIADSGNQRIRRVDPGGIITTIAGTGTAGFSGDGAAATGAAFSTPIAVAVDASGAVYVVDLDNNRIRRFVVGGAVTTFAGTATSVGDGGPSTQARVEPWSIAVDSAGNLYIADRDEQRVRKVTPSGTITTAAGTGQTGYSGDNGPGASAALGTPNGVAVDSAGNVYIADANNNRIRRVDASTGKITTFAGGGSGSYTGTGTGGDGGMATSATLNYPTSVAVDGAGNVYFVQWVQSNTYPQAIAVRRVTTDGKINTWAGGGTTATGYGGDGGPPLKAVFGSGINIAAGPDGSLYIVDTNNHRVRKVDPAGATITTVAGNGQNTASGNGGAATSAGVPYPWSVVVDAAGNLYIGNIPSVRKVSPGGIIGPYAGNGQYSFSGDGGPATSAAMTGASGLALDSGGNLFMVDSGNRRVRMVQPGVAPVIALSSTSVTFNLATTGSTATTQTFTVANTGQGTLNWAAAATSGGAWLTVSPPSGKVLAGQPASTVTVTANPAGLAAGDYYGQIQITSPNAASPFQTVTVRMTVQTAAADPPHVAAGGVLNAASFALQTPVAPGTLVSIFGSNFLNSTDVLVATTFPWPAQLGGTSVTIGGEPVPVYVVTAGQINAILPYSLTVNTSLPLVVTRGNAVSAPEPVSLISSQPGAFTQTQDGQGVGAMVIVHPDQSWVIAGNGNSVKAGDVLEIYCTGLGDVTPRVVAGSPAPPSPLSQVIDPVTLTIGGVKVPVFFAGPTPGFTGLYQVNATIPAGLAPSPQAPLVLSQGGRTSATITVPVQ